MNTSSDSLAEMIRKSETLVLQGLSEHGAAAMIAKAMQQSEATVSRFKNDHLHLCIQVISLLGLKVVPAFDKTINEDRLRAIAKLAHYALSSEADFTNAILGDKE